MSAVEQRGTEEHETEQPQAKRQKLDITDDKNGATEQISQEQAMDVEPQLDSITVTEAAAAEETDTSGVPIVEALLPPSRVLLGKSPASHAQKTSTGHTLEFDVGITEYISNDLPPVHAIIKQRFTDFLVHEVNLDGEVIHVQSLDMPHSEKKPTQEVAIDGEASGQAALPDESKAEKINEPPATSTATELPNEEKAEAASKPKEDTGQWSEEYTATLTPFLSEPLIAQLKQMYLEGSEPPFVSDSGWGSRQPKPSDSGGVPEEKSEEKAEEKAVPASGSERGKRGKRGRDRGGRGRGGGGRNGDRKAQDPRKVISDPIDSKATRTGLHQVIRKLFGGKLDSETDTSKPDEDGRIVIKWARRGQGRENRGRDNQGGDRKDRPSRGTYPPYIHFTLQKTNRDTQDALGNISRTLRCSIKDLSVAGTKDKRGVTVQRVALRRGNKTVEDVWKMLNGHPGRKSYTEVVSERGERGVRVADFKYGKAGLDLGMLKGNTFIITLRNVHVEPLDTLDKAMQSLKDKGFINYYGMQRFGTASIPTHSIGLAFLQCDWARAASLILCHRPGEHPDVVAARDAWLVEKDLDKALELFPRRVVAERCILESFKKMKGDTRNIMGALSTIPRNLRLMYVHAYQSYVWNAIVSERIRLHGADKPVVGDLVFEQEGGRLKKSEETEDAEMGEADEEDIPEENTGSRKSKRPWVAPRVKTLTEEDVDNYTMFDVIMPLPGKDVAYPGGVLGEQYREFLKLDGLDPDNFSSKHKDYNLSGSYRKIVLKPKELSWSVLRYTDPDVPLAQSDEDKLLGKEPPVIDENGKFIALQVNLQLSTAAYATMALREVTKTETSSHYQTSLTHASEDQAFRGSKGGEEMEN